MEFLSPGDPERALALAKIILDRVSTGSEITISADDTELVILGLLVIVRKSEHAHRLPEIGIWL